MPYTSFAVAGAGPTIGSRIVQALVDRGASVVVLARPGSSSIQNPRLQGAKIITVDYTDVRALVPILQEHSVEVVVSALAAKVLTAQRPIAEAAKEAGVKLIVPSEFGMTSAGGRDSDFVACKSEFAEYVKSLGIPALRVYTGFWIEYIPQLVGVELGKPYLVGKQTVPNSFTALDDIAGFVAHVLTTLPPSSLHNVTFRIQGDRMSLAAIHKLYEARVPPVPVHATESPERQAMRTFFQKKFEAGRLSTGWDNYLNKDIPENAGSSNKVWEGHKWKSVKEVLGL